MIPTNCGTNKLDVEIVNIVASGKLNVELALAAVAEDLEDLEWVKDVEHSRRRGNRLLIHFTEATGLGILAPTGVYVFTGIDSYDELELLHRHLIRSLATLGIISSKNLDEREIIDPFEVQNVVCTADLERSIHLEALAIGLGLEQTEYEPEQFPGLVYRPDTSSCTLLIFATGKIVITGIKNSETAQKEFDKLQRRIISLYD